MRLLVALDGSDHSLRAFHHAVSIVSGNSEAELLLFCGVERVSDVVPAPFGAPTVVSEQMIDQSLQNRKDVAQSVLDKYGAICEEKKIKHAKLLIAGEPREDICIEAKRNAVDFIVMGSRGLGTLSRYVFVRPHLGSLHIDT
eukprot:TRINITY_DN1763_c0_g1_i2.p1 TRINITY_DN1763_c0_g1~~TRINITY_DN1763_c0_g1_i2.p1  ORF type:complete len:142 (+),score=20.31 TRINITY_DN1763_c0_g1_i2:103-528(+)